MRISALIKKLQTYKKEHGDIPVLFDEYTMNTYLEENQVEDYRIDEENCIRPFRIVGVHKVSYEDRAARPKVLLFGLKDGDSAFEEKT